MEYYFCWNFEIPSLLPEFFIYDDLRDGLELVVVEDDTITTYSWDKIRWVPTFVLKNGHQDFKQFSIARKYYFKRYEDHVMIYLRHSRDPILIRTSEDFDFDFYWHNYIVMGYGDVYQIFNVDLLELSPLIKTTSKTISFSSEKNYIRK